MARLVGVVRHPDQEFGCRQLPLEIQETLSLVIQFPDPNKDCDMIDLKSRDLENFLVKFSLLSKEELDEALVVTEKEVAAALSQAAVCVGCRRSVERLFMQLIENDYPAIEPFYVTGLGLLAIEDNLDHDPREFFNMFYLQGAKFQAIIDCIPKSKKSRRCLLHSLETQRTKSLGTWLEVWDLMDMESQDEVILVEHEFLLETIETYLKKHRFCMECKSKVMRALELLEDAEEAEKEKSYVATLYEGLTYCEKNDHIHVNKNMTFLSELISRAEPELRGNTRERHAKTIQNAQEEVLTCLGICLYDRLHRIWQRLHEEEQTWHILYHLGISMIRKNFELAVEKKQGFSQLERLCEEISREEQAKELKREHKRQKRKRKKNTASDDKENEMAKCDEDSAESREVSGDSEEVVGLNLCNCDPDIESENCLCCKSCCSLPRFHDKKKDAWSPEKHSGFYNDSGYCSGHSSESSPGSSSCESSDVACTEGLCNHDVDTHNCHNYQPLMDSQERCCTSLTEESRDTPCYRGSASKWVCSGANSACCKFDRMSLQYMLEETCESDEDDSGIHSEELHRLKENSEEIKQQQQELRCILRQRFANFTQRGVRLRCLMPRRSWCAGPCAPRCALSIKQ